MSYTPLVDPIFTGNPRVPTASPGDNDTTAASTAFVTAATGFYLPLAGGTMSGDITLGSGVDINFNDTSSGLQWSDVRLSRSAPGIIAMGATHKLQQNAAPTVGDDLTNKTYVDALANGLDWKASVRVATAAALPAYARVGNVITASANGSINVAGIDSVTTLANTNRVLLKNGASNVDNGIYVITDIGSAGTPFILTRATDADVSAEVTAGMAMFVAEGTINSDQGWVLTTNDPIVLNTDALVFTQFSSATVVSTLDSLSDVNTTGVVDGSLLRYEASGTVWEDTSTLLYSDAGQLSISAAGVTGGILIGGDALWYRDGNNEMRTPDALIVDGLSTLTGAVTATAGVTATTGGFTATAGNIVATAGNITATAGNLIVTAGTSTLGGKVTMSAGQRAFYGTVRTGAYTAVLATDYIIPVNSSGGAFTVALPAGHAAGDTLIIKDVTGSCEANNVTINPDAAETIEGAATFLMTVNYQSVTIVSNGTNWFVI